MFNGVESPPVMHMVMLCNLDESMHRRSIVDPLRTVLGWWFNFFHFQPYLGKIPMLTN